MKARRDALGLGQRDNVRRKRNREIAEQKNKD